MNFCNVNFVADKELMGRRESGGALLQFFYMMWYNQMDKLEFASVTLDPIPPVYKSINK